MPDTMYPPAAPTISAADNTITVDLFLRTPTRVTREVANLTNQRFIAETIFTRGTAQGGAVIFDQTTTSDLGTELYTVTGRDVQAIAPGSEFPIVDFGQLTPMVAKVTKWGGAFFITYEERDRDDRPVLGRNLIRLRNTLVRKVDTVAMAALAAAPVNTMTASGPWATTGDLIGDLETARSTIDDADMGYEADTILLNPAQRIAIRKNSALRDAMPRENAALNPVTSRELNGLLGFDNWIVTNRVPAGTVWVINSGTVGSIRDETPLYSRVVDQPENERVLVMAGRRTVPIVTDPKAVVKITGA